MSHGRLKECPYVDLVGGLDCFPFFAERPNATKRLLRLILFLVSKAFQMIVIFKKFAVDKWHSIG